MATTLTAQNKKSLKQLLKTGRWNNESEIMRYGLHLVIEEVRSKQTLDLSPISDEVLARALRKKTRKELAEEKLMAKASMRHKPRDKDFE
jgi:Arc/MetJ-type ribon-helix-helix transcriptional regulator